ncbi:Uncharacterised protein [Mycobacteroides abscessus subsp. abscessus]|nr:Uncharacterised protein [Mycobacteroides abscessus subsp. abscessus]
MGAILASRRANIDSKRTALARLLAEVSASTAASEPAAGESSTSAASISATRSSISASISSATSPMRLMTSGDGVSAAINEVCACTYRGPSTGPSHLFCVSWHP